MLRATPICLATLVCFCHGLPAAEVDVTKLATPAQKQIDFTRDIKPILANNCYKCHGDEKPKSGFRLTSRESALKGGDNGADIIPGQSAKSPLIHYVSRIVPDMEMPPEGRGTPLTPEQVGLLRAWIDQGVPWEQTQKAPATQASATPIVGWTGVDGRAAKFRELFWQPEGWNGGLEDFESSERPNLDTRITSAGHFLRDDYKLTLSAEKNNLGFTHLGWSQFRKYFDDSGGYYPGFSPSNFTLNRDLHMDTGRAWADFGLTLPRWPRFVLGYEYQYRDGTKSTLEWGPVTDGTETRNIYPAFKDISEHVHILKFDADYELAGVDISESFRGEWYDLGTERRNESSFALGALDAALTKAKDRQTYFQGANTLHLEKRVKEWLFASGGYLYSKLDSDASMDVETLNPSLLDPLLSAPGWQSDRIELERESHVFSLSSMLGPWEGLLLSLGTQNEWTRQQGIGGSAVNLAVPFDPFLLPLDPERIRSDVDRSVFSQEASLRFTKIPFTTLYAEARLEQDRTGEFQEESGGFTPFLRDTDISSDLEDLRAGFNTSPWRHVSFNGHYRQYEKDSDYDNARKELLGSPYEGYPGFLRSRKVLSREAELKLNLQPAMFLKTSLSYKWLGNRYHASTDPASDFVSGLAGGISPGGELLAGAYDAHTVSLNATLTPWKRMFLSATAAYQNARTVTSANGSPSVAPYEGDIYSVAASGSYSFNDATRLTASYSFSIADFAQENFAEGLPLGVRYQQHGFQLGIKRRLGKGKILGLQYRFYHYDEPSSGGFNDFDAHAVFATLAFRLP